MTELPHSSKMTWLGGGVFAMGTSTADIDALLIRYQTPHRFLFESETPRHPVELSPFFIDHTPVTNAQFLAFLRQVPQWRPDRIASHLHNGDYLRHWQGLNFPPGQADHPVVYVPWYAAAAYADWAGKRLPSEAEWEYAARGGLVNAQYPWGDAAPTPALANYSASAIGGTTAVGAYPPNGYGLFDLAGNVWEYCRDEWQPAFYAASPRQNPLADGNLLHPDDFTQVSTRRVIRGGSWGGSPINLRVAYRDSHPPQGAGPHMGFRCVHPA